MTDHPFIERKKRETAAARKVLHAIQDLDPAFAASLLREIANGLGPQSAGGEISEMLARRHHASEEVGT